jgi:hypothetical protein
MVIYTVMRHLGYKDIPLRSFDNPEEAEKFAELQMRCLLDDCTYSIAVWNLDQAHVVPCIDRRLRLVK